MHQHPSPQPHLVPVLVEGTDSEAVVAHPRVLVVLQNGGQLGEAFGAVRGAVGAVKGAARPGGGGTLQRQ